MNPHTFRYVLMGAWALLIALLPFIVTSQLFFPYIVGKNLFFRAIVDIILVLWIASAIQYKELRPQWSWILGVFAGFTIWVGIADTVSINPLRSFWSNFERMEGYITILHLFALFLVSAASLTKNLWYKLIGWSVIISGIAWLQGMVEHFKNPVFRIDGSFGNATYFAAYALLHVFFAALLAMRYRTHRYLWITLAICNASTIFYTGTRGALIGLIGGIGLAAILYVVCEWKNTKVRNISVGIIGLIVACVAILGLVKDTKIITSSPVLYRFSELSHYVVTLDFKGLFETAGRSRVAIWDIAWEGVKERPLLGWGQDNFIHVFSKYYDPGIFDQEQWFDRTHNVFFDWLIAAGFIGLLGYVGIFAAMLWCLWRSDAFELQEKIIFTGLCGAYFIHTFFVFDNITTYIFIMLILAYVHSGTQKAWQEDRRAKVRPVPYLASAGWIVALIVACGINIPVYATGSNLLEGLKYSHGDGTEPPNDTMISQSHVYFQKALAGSDFAKVEIREQLVDASYRVRNSAAATSTKAEFVRITTEQVEQNIIERPYDARAHYFAGIYYGSLGNNERAAMALESALAASPRKQTMMFALADVYRRMNRMSEALELYKQAFELAPRFVEPRLRYAQMLLSLDRVSEANELLREVSDDMLADKRYVNLLLAINRYDIVVTIFENEHRINPGHIPTRISLAAAYVEVGRNNDAIALLETISRDVPQSKSQIDFFISEIRAGRNPVQR